ncbi:MAG: hypothetical protein CK547_07150 [Chitinophagaceae bacterium]|nr:MAG: hypothetical protein CK547_07150 [Chitinophagaceae bacterium]
MTVYGQFEEQLGQDLSTARDILFSRVMPLMTSASVNQHGHAQPTENTIIEDDRIKPVMFKIRINEKQGGLKKYKFKLRSFCIEENKPIIIS